VVILTVQQTEVALMPKPGFKSITVSEVIYEKYYTIYEKNKEQLKIQGVESFSGYITNVLNKGIQFFELYDKMVKEKEDAVKKMEAIMKNA